VAVVIHTVTSASRAAARAMPESGLTRRARKPASANSDADSEKPGAPTTANAANTTLPVMFATKTRPRARIETASTTPVTTVSVSSNARIGPNAGSATSDRLKPTWCLAVPSSLSFDTFLLIAGFVGGHKPRRRPAGGGYKRLRRALDLVYYFLQPHRTGESIQDKSQDDRLYICHQPAYD